MSHNPSGLSEATLLHIPWVNKYFLSTHCVPGMVLGAEATM